MGRPANKLRDKLRKEVKAAGGVFYNFQTPGAAGAQDAILLFPVGRIYFVEIKAIYTNSKDRESPLQKKRREETLALGFLSEIISSTEEIDQLMERIESDRIAQTERFT